jgi:hypothetical protein
MPVTNDAGGGKDERLVVWLHVVQGNGDPSFSPYCSFSTNYSSGFTMTKLFIGDTLQIGPTPVTRYSDSRVAMIRRPFLRKKLLVLCHSKPRF